MTDNRTEPVPAATSTLSIGFGIFGIPVKLHYSFFLLLGIEFSLSIIKLNVYWSLFVFLLYGPILFITILIHELGHCFATVKQGGQVGGIVLWPLGGFALCGATEKGAKGDFLVALAGPLTHIPQSFVWYGLYYLTSRGLSDLSKINTLQGFTCNICAYSVYINVVLFCVNLLFPAYPLDGGRCLASSLIMCGVRLELAAYITSITSMGIASMFLIYGLITLLGWGSPESLFLILIAAYLLYESMRLYSMTKDGKIKEHEIFGRDCYDDAERTNNGNDDATVATAIDEPQNAQVV